MAQHLDVFVSSTKDDLIPYRAAVKDAILNLGLHPIVMETFPAEDATAVEACRRYVEDVELFVGIYAHRWGWTPRPDQGGDGERSITALEFDWATERGIPRLCFIIDEDHPWPLKWVEDEPGKSRLAAFKASLSEEVIRRTFTTPENLAQQVTEALHHAVLRLTGGAPEVGGWRRPTPPLLAHRFVGRAQDVNAITALLRQPGAAVVVRGLGGIGKTTLALHLAHLLKDDFPGGVLWASLGPEAKSPDTVLPSILAEWAQASPAGRTLEPERLTPDTLRRLLADSGGRLLAVLDDVWHLAPARELLKALPDGTACLITTRQPNVTLGESYPLLKLNEADACALLADRLRAGGDDPDPHADGLRAVARTLDGHALALELAAAQLITHGAAYAPRLADRLKQQLESESEFRLLKVEDSDSRDDNLEAALELSYAPLPGDLKQKFRALGVIAPDAPFAPATAFAVWGVDPDDESARDAAEDALAGLVKAGLLARLPGTDRLTQHMLLRAYARALARRHDEHDSALGRYIRHVTFDLVRFYELPMQDWNTQIGPDLPHIHHVGNALLSDVQSWVPGETPLESLAQPEPPNTLPAVDPDDGTAHALLERGEDFAYQVIRYIHYRSIGDEGRRWLWLGLACARLRSSRKREGVVLNELGLWHNARGQQQPAIGYYEASLVIARELGDQKDEGTTLNNLGAVYDNLGQVERARDLYEQSLAIRREVGDRAGEGATLNNLGAVYDNLGQYEQARNLYEQALAIRREVGDRAGEGATLSNLGLVYNNLGQYEQARDLYEQALAIRREVGARAGEGTTLSNLGQVYDNLGQYKQARDLYEQSLAIRREVGDRAGEGTTLNNLGEVYRGLGQVEQARDLYEQALAIRREVGDRAGEGATLNNLGLVYRALGQVEQARELYEQALAIQREAGDRAGEGTTLNNLGYVYDNLGQVEQARDLYEQALAIHREVGNRAMEGTTLSNLGYVYDNLGQVEQARDLYEQALAIHREVGNRATEGTMLNNLGGVYYALGQYEQARDLYEQALAIHREVGKRATEGTTLSNLGHVYDNLEQVEQARDSYEQALAIHREVGNRAMEGATLDNLGAVYRNLGQVEQARDLYEQALAIHREVGNRAMEAVTCYNLGSLLHYAWGRTAEAITYLERCVQIDEEIGHPDLESDRADLEKLRRILSDQSPPD